MEKQTHIVTISDDDIIQAVNECLPEVRHLDMLSELELVTIQMAIQKNTKQFDKLEVSLWWLRNRIIQLRKGGFIKSKRPPAWLSDMARKLT